MTAPRGRGSFCHAFDNRSLHFVNWGETLMMIDRLLKSTPARWQVNRVQIRAIRWTKCLAQWTEGSHAASFCVSGSVIRSTVLLQWPCVRHHLILMSGSFAKHQVTWCLSFRLIEWKRLLHCIAHAQHSDGRRMAQRMECSHSHCQTSGVDVFTRATLC